jgi:prophage regulatory protein
MSDGPLRVVGAHEIRACLGNVSRQRVYQLTARTDFPRPIAELAQGKVWLASDVEAWIATRRAAGTTKNQRRPAKTSHRPIPEGPRDDAQVLYDRGPLAQWQS